MPELNRKSTLAEIYANPAGRDVLHKICLQLNLPEKLIFEKSPAGRLTLDGLNKLTGNKFSEGFFEALLSILNTDAQEIKRDTIPQKEIPWWKTAVFYQIYPRSFYDADGDGIGDLKGIIKKLDYLKELGVDALWLSPVYDSPNDDNGYDIRNYKAIMQEFGTMEDMDELICELHKRGMRLIMDLVINHTSDEHEWFQKALADENSPYRDYYFFRKQQEIPNNWSSFFEGSAWRYFEEQDIWGLHLFSKKQMDLNWDNPALRNDVIEMIRWWLEKGIDGFRMDVINYISKREGLPMGDETIGAMMEYTGIEHYFYGPHLHDYLHQVRTQAFEPFGAFSVGETPGIGMEMAKKLTGQGRRELDMLFNFDHLETPGHVRFDDYRYDLNYLKSYMTDWMENYGPDCQMALFWDNHDNPRMISKIEPDPKWRVVLAKLLAMIQLTLKGTPFLFQGQEIGMINQKFTSPSQLRDIESWNLYEKLCRSMPAAEAFAKVAAGSRDHARTPMQWDNSDFGGFTQGKKTWIEGDGDYVNCNAEEQISDPDSVLWFHRELLRLRRQYPLFGTGKIKITNKDRKNLFTYYRYDGQDVFYVECNLGRKPLYVGKRPENMVRIMGNYTDGAGSTLKAYETNLYRVNKK